MLYICLTLISAFAKLVAFEKARSHSKQGAKVFNALVILLIITLGLQSIFEILLYVYAYDIESAASLWSLKGYYLCLFGVIGVVPCVAVVAANIRINFYIVIAALISYSTLVVAILFSDTIIAGVALEPTTHSLTKIQGSHYYVFQMAALMSPLFSMLALLCPLTNNKIIKALTSRKKEESYYVRTRSFNLLIAFIPVFVFAFFIVSAMAAGFQINAVGVLPFCFLIWVVALVHNMNPLKQPDYSALVPGTKKFSILKKKFLSLLYVDGSGEVLEVNDDLVEHYLSQGLKQNKIATMLNISPATVTRAKQRIEKAKSKALVKGL